MLQAKLQLECMYLHDFILIYRTELTWILLLLQDELFMHLTNYSINKHNDNFDRDDSDDSGSKRYVQHSDEELALEMSAFQNSLRRLIYPYQLYADN